MPVSKNTRKNGKVVPYKVPVEPSKRDQFIAEAKNIKAGCLGLIANCANVGQIIQAAKASPDIKLDEPRVGKLAMSLADDLKTLQAELNVIDVDSDKTLSVVTNSTDEIEVMNLTIQIGTAYQNWQERFLQITGPTMEEIVDLCTGEK